MKRDTKQTFLPKLRHVHETNVAGHIQAGLNSDFVKRGWDP